MFGHFGHLYGFSGQGSLLVAAAGRLLSIGGHRRERSVADVPVSVSLRELVDVWSLRRPRAWLTWLANFGLQLVLIDAYSSRAPRSIAAAVVAGSTAAGPSRATPHAAVNEAECQDQDE